MIVSVLTDNLSVDLNPNMFVNGLYSGVNIIGIMIANELLQSL